MADVGSTDILSEIQALVSDKLQVVSYKWLSRNFTVSSNDSKRLLLEFVEKHGSGLEVVYTLSGWLKNDPPPVYHIRLVSGSKLAEVKQEFEDNCSVQVYSVQACIPKDLAVLWNAEFVQAEELFNQPSTVDNCLRDNRYCGVSNSFVKRNAKETPPVFVPPQRNNSGVTGPSKSSSANQTPFVPQPQEGKIQQVSPKIGLQSTTVASNDVKNEHSAREVHAHTTKPHMDKEKGTAFPANKKTAQNDKGSSGTGGSLASLWGRASTKSKPSCPPAETNNVVPNTSEAQICAHEAVDAVSSDDEGQIIKHKRASNGEGSRKRRVVFDFSDEENEDAVNLASPDPPKRQSSPDSKHNKKSSVLETNNLDFEEEKEENPKVKQETITERDSSLWREDPVANQKKPGISLLDKSDNAVPKNDLNKKEKTTEAAPNSPKRRKVLKTRIDERGREVTEVVWEDEGAESKTTEKNPVNNVNNRPPATKSPAVGAAAPSIPAGKAGNKKAGKGGVKDPKQGNIMSFFKRV